MTTAAAVSQPLRPLASFLKYGAERGSNFFLGFVFLSAEKRQALSAVYAYCRLIDDIVDSGNLKPAEAARLLDFWRAEIGRLYSGTPTHTLALRLLPVVERYRLPQEPFLEMIRGCSMDLERTDYETFADLEGYLRGVACSVGRLCVDIFGYAHTRPADMEDFSRFFGYAFQLTNIIRDVGADLEMGRVYLPREDMRSAGYSPEALKRREGGPAFERLMELEYLRARSYYRKARALVDFRDRPALVPAEIMAHIYEELLEQTRRSGFPVFFKRESLSPWRKAGLAFKAWFYCHGVHV